MTHAIVCFQSIQESYNTKLRRLNNGLLQDSVLTSIEFHLHTCNLPTTTFRQFIYDDNITVTTHHNKFEVTEEILTKDSGLISEYLYKRRLIPNTDKTVVTSLHLNNQLAKYKSQIQFGGKRPEYDPTPKYLGVVLDRQLTFKQYFENTAAKLKT